MSRVFHILGDAYDIVSTDHTSLHAATAAAIDQLHHVPRGTELIVCSTEGPFTVTAPLHIYIKLTRLQDFDAA